MARTEDCEASTLGPQSISSASLCSAIPITSAMQVRSFIESIRHIDPIGSGSPEASIVNPEIACTCPTTRNGIAEETQSSWAERYDIPIPRASRPCF